MPQLIQKNPAFYQASEAVLKWRENTNQGTVARAAWWRLHAQCGMPGCLCCMPVAWHLIMPRNSPRSSFWQSTGQLLELCCSATHWPHGQPNQHSPGKPWWASMIAKGQESRGVPLKRKMWYSTANNNWKMQVSRDFPAHMLLLQLEIENNCDPAWERAEYESFLHCLALQLCFNLSNVGKQWGIQLSLYITKGRVSCLCLQPSRSLTSCTIPSLGYIGLTQGACISRCFLPI